MLDGISFSIFATVTGYERDVAETRKRLERMSLEGWTLVDFSTTYVPSNGIHFSYVMSKRLEGVEAGMYATAHLQQSPPESKL